MSHALQGNGTQPRTASIRARPTSSRITATELEELFQRQQGSGGSALMSSYFQASADFVQIFFAYWHEVEVAWTVMRELHKT